MQHFNIKQYFLEKLAKMQPEEVLEKIASRGRISSKAVEEMVARLEHFGKYISPEEKTLARQKWREFLSEIRKMDPGEAIGRLISHGERNPVSGSVYVADAFLPDYLELATKLTDKATAEWHYYQGAKTLAALEKYDPAMFESIVRSTSPEALKHVAKIVPKDTAKAIIKLKPEVGKSKFSLSFLFGKGKK